ncbi:MAG: hypothetical protein ACK4Y4_09285, partial [Brevundimonas sp.]
MSRNLRPNASWTCCFPCPCPPRPRGSCAHRKITERRLPLARLTIDTEYLTGRLERLLGIASPTGYTDEVVWEVCRELGRLGVDYELTRRGAIR